VTQCPVEDAPDDADDSSSESAPNEASLDSSIERSISPSTSPTAPLTELAVAKLIAMIDLLQLSIRHQAQTIGELAGSISDLADSLSDFIVGIGKADDSPDAESDDKPPEYDLEGKPIPRN
jgi:hypothetical protein